MFSELIKLRELGRLLKKRRYLEVLALARDPAIREHRKAVVATEKARKALLAEAEAQRARGEVAEAFQNVRAVLQDGEDPAARRLEEELRRALGDKEQQARALDAEVRRARVLAEDGDVQGALARLEPLAADHEGAQKAVRGIKQKQEDRAEALSRLKKALARKDLTDARRLCNELRRADPESDALAGLLTDLVKLASKSDDTDALGGVLKDTRGFLAPEDGTLFPARKRAAGQYLARIEKALRNGDHTAASKWLDAYPLGIEGDDTASGWARALRVLDRARRMDKEGDAELATRLAEEARDALPPSPVIKEFLDDVARRRKQADGPLAEARSALGEGRLIVARKALVQLLDAQPGQREALDLLDTLEAQDKEDREALATARRHMDAGIRASLDEARKLLTGLAARRPDLDEVPVLLQDVERRGRDARLAALDDESRLLSAPTNGAATASTLRGPVEPPQRPGLRPVVFRSVEDLPGAGTLSHGLPFILRVEEQGDWFVHPGPSLLIGNATRGVADIPVLAAVGSRHARIERITDGGGTRYRVVPTPGRKVTRNRKKVKEQAILEHGDVIGLGPSLTFTFRRPVEGSATAVLELGGDFTVRGCRRVLLFSESGREGSVVLGPGPQAHIPLSPDKDRVEVLRGTSGETDGILLARSPRGVAVEEGSERPQIRIRPGVPIRAGQIGFFVDPV